MVPVERRAGKFAFNIIIIVIIFFLRNNFESLRQRWDARWGTVVAAGTAGRASRDAGTSGRRDYVLGELWSFFDAARVRCMQIHTALQWRRQCR